MQTDPAPVEETATVPDTLTWELVNTLIELQYIVYEPIKSTISDN